MNLQTELTCTVRNVPKHLAHSFVLTFIGRFGSFLFFEAFKSTGVHVGRKSSITPVSGSVLKSDQHATADSNELLCLGSSTIAKKAAYSASVGRICLDLLVELRGLKLLAS